MSYEWRDCSPAKARNDLPSAIEVGHERTPKDTMGAEIRMELPAAMECGHGLHGSARIGIV